MRRCEDEKMRCRPPLLEEPCAQTLSGEKKYIYIYRATDLHFISWMYVKIGVGSKC